MGSPRDSTKYAARARNPCVLYVALVPLGGGLFIRCGSPPNPGGTLGSTRRAMPAGKQMQAFESSVDVRTDFLMTSAHLARRVPARRASFPENGRMKAPRRRGGPTRHSASDVRRGWSRGQNQSP